MRALAIGATGMLAQQLNVDTISNNIANMTTTGFKRSRAEFADLMYENIQRAGSATTDGGTLAPTGISVGSGVRPVGVYRINEQGSVQQTGNKLDLAIQGRGFIQVQLPSGETAYTRDGALALNAQGQIVTADGFVTVPNITVPNNVVDITVNKSGEVYVKLDGQTALQNIGQLQLATFVNDAGLEATGGNMYKETEASGAPTVGNPNDEGYGYFMQGALENSNVNIVAEMTSLITAQRAYEMNSKVIRTGDDMLAALNQIK
ncbi:MAG TPA: flagellar basal-body rod protein FlgG [Alphaproteobacteria bacterium]|nr:flagellar basal-body rod protein FlgG [Rhodospirillaceae bacterium]HRJ12880.1 flagellar basal-body rod protein FlgG [Alphaproteobacteria bacterium]